jgi:hypothetical protein
MSPRSWFTRPLRARPHLSRWGRSLSVEVLEDRQAPAVLTVNSTLDTASPSDPYLSLREALAIVNSPSLPGGLSNEILDQIDGTLHQGHTDAIVFDPNTVTGPITLTGTQLRLSLPGSTAAVTIDGGDGVTVDAAGRSRVLQVDSGVQATLDHLTITHGNVTGFDSGAGILNAGSLTVSHSTLSGNSAAYYSGGGIYNSGGTVTVSNSTLSSNSAGYSGGGIDNSGGTLTVSQSTLSSNSATSGGGGIYNDRGAVMVSHSTLSANSTAYDGGGIYNLLGTVTVSHSTLSSNSAGYFGGGINDRGTLTVSNSTLSANSANYDGGGIYSGYGGAVTVSNSTLSANSAGEFSHLGGGICNSGGTVTVSHSTLSSNSGGYGGGGIYNSSGTLTVSNSTLSANSASYGGGIFNSSGTLTVSNSTLTGNSAAYSGGGIDIDSGTPRLQDTLVAGNTAPGRPDVFGGVQPGSSYNLVGVGDASLTGISNGTGGNLVGSPASPIDPRLGPLADNGGPTLTHALLPDSPARGAGSLEFATPTDQRGLPRVVGGEIDLGAYQTQAAVAGPQVVLSDPDRVVDAPVDHVRLTFNHPLDPASVAAGQFGLTGPTGPILVSRVTAVDHSLEQQFDVGFPPQAAPGDYALTVGTGVRDAYGTPLSSPLTLRFLVVGPGCTLTVNSTADTADPSAPYLTLREAVAIANSPSLPADLSPQILGQISGRLHANGSDRIVFDPAGVSGPIVLGGTQLELTLSGRAARVTIDGGDGVTVDAAGHSRVLQVDSGVQAILDHLTITHGNLTGNDVGAGILNAGSLTVSQSTLSSNSANDSGGGIYNSGGTVTVSQSTLSSNSANYYGGGIYNSGGTLTVSQSTLSSNSAYVSGGGIYNDRGTLTVSHSTLSANSVGTYDGGGISNLLGTVTVSHSTLSANTAGYGGGIYNSVGALTVSHSTLSANIAGSYGGGIYNDRGTVTVNNCTLSANSAASLGGGIYNDRSTATVSNSTLSANSAGYGGGIYNSFGTVTVSNSTLFANSAGYSGGGIYNSGTLTVSKSTLAANTAANLGGGIYIYSGTPRLHNTLVAGNRSPSIPDVGGAVDSASSYNLVGNGTGLTGISNGVNHNQIGSTASPIDPLLASLDYYGGPTSTFALRPGSPAQNAGEPAVTGTDQRGQPRLAGSSDIGAFQTQVDPFLVTTLSDPGRVSGLLSLREAVALANVLPGDTTVSFAEHLDGGVVTLTSGQLELSGSGGLEAIDGAGRFTLDGGNSTRLVEVDPGTRAILRALALVNGNAPSGAALYNRGILTVADCVLYGNTAYAGGAVLNQGDLTVWGCTLAFNVATLGAAIDNEAVLTAYNSTIGYNAALGSGGAVLNQPTGTATLTSLTISLNSGAEGGGIDVVGGLVVLRNCIVAGNYSADASAASDVAGTVGSTSSWNLIGTGGSGGLSNGMNHNQVGVADPGLTTPDFTGPQTPVFGFTSDSPAVGAGDPTLLADPVLRLDQHGNLRTVVNIGAV